VANKSLATDLNTIGPVHCCWCWCCSQQYSYDVFLYDLQYSVRSI